ncbi:MAG: alpha/beta hydrolase [Promethearchaeota archaeon]
MSKSIINKRVALFVIFLALFICGTVLIFTVPTSIKITYSQKIQTEDGVTIYFNVFEPDEKLYQAKNGAAKKKVILIGHGHRANKEMLKGYAIELAAAGFIAIPFDFRGHGQSTGVLERDKLRLDVQAILKYLETRDDVDLNNFGYIGYSMGGFPGWQIVHEDTRFKCFIGIGTGLPSSSYNPEYAVKVSSRRKLNVLMIMGKFDEAVTVDRLKEGMALRLGMPAADIDINKLYGSFQAGTASMIYVDDNSNHLLLCWDQDFIRVTRDWVINTFPSVCAPDENFYVNIRGIILLIQMIGGMGLFFTILQPLSDYILALRKKEGAEAREKTVGEAGTTGEIFLIEIPGTSITGLFLEALLFTLVLGLVGIFLFLPLTFVLPLTTMGQVIMLLFGQSFGILFLIWRLGKKAGISMKAILIKPFKHENDFLMELLLGGVLAVIIYLIVYFSIGLNYFGLAPSVAKFIYIPMYLVIEFLILLVFNIFANATFQAKFKDMEKGNFKAGLLIFVLQIIYMIVFLLFLSYLQGSLFTFGVFMPVVIPTTILGSYISVYCYEETRNITVGTIITTVIIILETTTVSIL